MGRRLRSEKPERLKEYTIRHTRISEQTCGNHVTALHLMRHTDQFAISIESWASSCNSFKLKRDKLVPEFNIPILTDKLSLSFLNELWKIELKDDDNVDLNETERFLSELFPGKKLEYVFELNHLHGAYCNGALTKSSHWFESRKKQRDYYLVKYLRELGTDTEKIWFQYDKAKAFVEKNDMSSYCDILDTVCKHVVVCPYIFPEAILKRNDGEIFFIVSEDTVYFEIRRSI